MARLHVLQVGHLQAPSPAPFEAGGAWHPPRPSEPPCPGRDGSRGGCDLDVEPRFAQPLGPLRRSVIESARLDPLGAEVSSLQKRALFSCWQRPKKEKKRGKKKKKTGAEGAGTAPEAPKRRRRRRRRKRKKVVTLLRPSNSVRVVPKHHHHEWSCAEKMPKIGLFGPEK